MQLALDSCWGRTHSWPARRSEGKSGGQIRDAVVGDHGLRFSAADLRSPSEGTGVEQMRDPWKRPENQNLMGKDCRATATIPVGSGQLPCTIAKRRAKWPSLVHRLTWFGILAAGVGCQSRQPLPQAAAKTQTVSPPTCTASQATPDGTCCPTGQFWLAGSLSCSSVGPPECATGVWSSPQACWPPWCQVGGSATCGSDGVGCGFSGDVCTPDQVGSGLACPAGALRSGARLCVAAGSFAGSGIDPSAVGEGALAALPADVSSTLGADLQVHPVPAIDQAFLCGSGGGEPYFCTSGEQAAPNSPSTSPAAPDLGCRSRNKELFCQWRTRVSMATQIGPQFGHKLGTT